MFDSQFSMLIRRDRKHAQLSRFPRMRIRNWELSIGQITERILANLFLRESYTWGMSTSPVLRCLLLVLVWRATLAAAPQSIEDVLGKVSGNVRQFRDAL